VEALPRIPKPEDLSNIIDKQRETGRSTFGLGGSLGLGFRYFIDFFVLSQKLSVFYISRVADPDSYYCVLEFLLFVKILNPIRIPRFRKAELCRKQAYFFTVIKW
jgi:hypothetical protein